MSTSTQIGLLILLATIAANVPFFNQRIMLLGPQRLSKPLLWRLMELLVLYFVVGVVGLALENQWTSGPAGLGVLCGDRHHVHHAGVSGFRLPLPDAPQTLSAARPSHWFACLTTT